MAADVIITADAASATGHRRGGHLGTTVQQANDRAARWLARYSIALLRISLGLVFLGFGALKFVPGLSPAEGLVQQTVSALTFGMVPAGASLILTATVESVIGLSLITGKFLRFGLALFGLAIVGIMSPVVLFAGELFPAGAPTIEGQYVLKDVVLLTAGLVVAAKALGARPVGTGE